MSTQTAQLPPHTGMKRSASISLLRGKGGSFRKKEGSKRNAPKPTAEIPRAPSRLAVPSSEDGVGSGGRLSFEVDPAISYAVSITAGNPVEKPKDKRGVFGRILHKRAASRAAQLPGISEDWSESKQSKWKTPAKTPSQYHLRSNSALSFFSSNERIAFDNDDENVEIHPWPSTQTFHPNYRPSPEPQRTSPMSKYNASQPVSGRPSLALAPSKVKYSSEKPQLKLVTKPEDLSSQGNLTRSASFASRAPYPPRKSSLQDNVTTEGPVHPEVSKATVIHSIESPAVHRREQSTEQVPTIHLEKSPPERSPPEPPPKDSAKVYDIRQQHIQQTQSLDLINVEPLDRFSVMFKDVLGLRASPTSPAYKKDTLPSPRLSKPRQSTLAKRRQAVPKMLQIMAKGQKEKRVRRFVGAAVLTPIQASKGSRSPKRSAAMSMSPVIGKAISTNVLEPKIVKAAAFAITLSQKPVYEAPFVHDGTAPLSSANLNDRTKIESLVLPIQLPDFMPIQEQKPAAVNLTHPRLADTVFSHRTKSPSRLKSPAALPPSIKSARRRSITHSGSHALSGSGQRPVRKSVHRRKPTGYRPLGNEMRRGRAAERSSADSIPPLPTAVDQGVSQNANRRRIPSPQASKLPARLTPPQLQGEWASENSSNNRGRRHPSPLRHEPNDVRAKTNPGIHDEPVDGACPRDSSIGTGTVVRSNSASLSHSHTETRAESTGPSSIEQPQSSVTPKILRRKERMGKLIKSGLHSRAPSHTAMLPLAMHPFPAAAAGAAGNADSLTADDTNISINDSRTLAQGRQILVGAGHKVTPEESIKRMMDKQREQQEALRAKLLGSVGRPSEATVRTL